MAHVTRLFPRRDAVHNSDGVREDRQEQTRTRTLSTFPLATRRSSEPLYVVLTLVLECVPTTTTPPPVAVLGLVHYET